MAMVHASSAHRNSQAGGARRFVGIVVLLVAAGAAVLIWWGRLARERGDVVVAFVQQLASSATPAGGEGVSEAAARTTLSAVSRNAAAGITIRVERGDVPEGDGLATHIAVVTSDIGDQIVLRIVCDPGGTCRVLAVLGEPRADPNAAIQRRPAPSQIDRPGIPR